MTSVTITLGVFILASGAALTFGSVPEKIGAVILALWLASDLLYYRLAGSAHFDRVDIFPAALDLMTFITFVGLALRANRLWPMAAAAAQSVPLTGHAVIAAGFPGMQRAYWAMTQLPPLIIAIVLLIGAFAHARRRKRLGAYPDWRRPATH